MFTCLPSLAGRGVQGESLVPPHTHGSVSPFLCRSVAAPAQGLADTASHLTRHLVKPSMLDKLNGIL